MSESPEERSPSDHDPDDQRGGGGEGGLSGAAPGADEDPTPEGETSIDEPEGNEPTPAHEREEG